MPIVVDTTAIRRAHACIDSPLVRPAEIRCPDCGSLLGKVMERVAGAVELQCRRCKDRQSDYKRWVFVFHTCAQDYVNAVRLESNTVDLAGVISENDVE
jgi:transposase